jgi:tripartite-type tricarboxylate transporter receptor subunit TctC
MRERILKLEAEPLGGTPDEMRDMIEKSTKTWAPVVDAAHIQID